MTLVFCEIIHKDYCDDDYCVKQFSFVRVILSHKVPQWKQEFSLYCAHQWRFQDLTLGGGVKFVGEGGGRKSLKMLALEA